MEATENPFAPGAGTQPPELTGRDQVLGRAKTVLARVKKGLSDRSILLVGLRGVGKTVLLNRIDDIAEKNGYLSTLIEAPENKSLGEILVPNLRQILIKLDRIEGTKEKLRTAFSALKAFASGFKIKHGDFGLEMDWERGVADSGVLDSDITDLFVAIGEAAKEKNTAVAILIDELQYVQEIELAALFAGLHRVGQKGLPLVLFGAGLPQLAGLSGKAKSYAERLFDFQTVGPLGVDDAKEAIKGPIEDQGVTINPDALLKIVETTEGYPYFLQEWGSHTWNCAHNSPIKLSDVERATTGAITALDQAFFRVRFERLTQSEKEYLRAMAELGRGPHRSGDIALKLRRLPNTVAPIRSKIIEKGMIYSPSYGDTAFTVPKFDEYMRRVIPVFKVHDHNGRKRPTAKVKKIKKNK